MSYYFARLNRNHDGEIQPGVRVMKALATEIAGPPTRYAEEVSRHADLPAAMTEVRRLNEQEMS